MHRRTELSLLAVLAVAMSVCVATPASAGYREPYAVHGFDPEQWTLVSHDCAGGPAAEPARFVLGRHQAHSGEGSLRVRAEGLGGVLARGTDGLKTLSVWALDDPADGDTTSQGQWRVELGEHVLVSDPVALGPGWEQHRLHDATLREDEWSGTVHEAIDEFGTGEWAAGLLTGGCLGSPTAYVDDVGRHRVISVADLEPSRWVEIFAPREGEDVVVPVGRVVPLGVRTWLTDLQTDESEALPGIRLSIERRWSDGTRWEMVAKVATERTGEHTREVVATRSAVYRVSWARAGRLLSRQEVLVEARVAFPAPRVDGRPCGAGGGRTCDFVRAGRSLVLTGSVRPAVGAVTVDLRDLTERRQLPTRTVAVGPHGGWRAEVGLVRGHRYSYWAAPVPGPRYSAEGRYWFGFVRP